MARLNTKDTELLRTGQDIDLSSKDYAYLGGEFMDNSEDFVEVLIYDMSENFLESAVVDTDDFIIDDIGGKKSVRLKTGTILRKMGYDRGRFTVKYNFLRKIAGSYETVLVDETNNIYHGDYNVQPNGKIVAPNNEELSIKEFKYFIHEISPSRKEVRLATQNIKSEKYLRDFYDLQKTIKRVVPDTSIPNHKLEFEDIGGLQNESKTIQFSQTPGGPVASFSDMMAGGILSISNAFVTEVVEPITQETPGNISNEVFGEELSARFAISDESQAEVERSARESTGGNRLDRLYEVYNGLLMTSPASALIGISRYGDGTVGGIQEIDETIYGSPKYVWSDNTSQIVQLTSISTIVEGSPNTYTWEVFGWDRDTIWKRNAFKQRYADGYTWNEIRVKTASNDGDVKILANGYEGTPQPSLIYTDPDRTGGSTIAVELHSKDMHVGVRLTVSNDLNQESTIVYPAFLKTG